MFVGEFLRELYLIESEFKNCILANEQKALNVSKYLLIEDKQNDLKSTIDFLKSGKLFFFYLIFKLKCSIIHLEINLIINKYFSLFVFI